MAEDAPKNETPKPPAKLPNTPDPQLMKPITAGREPPKRPGGGGTTHGKKRD